MHVDKFFTLQCSRLVVDIFEIDYAQLVNRSSCMRDMVVLLRFTISFGQLEAFENDERTRSFLSLLVDQGCKQVSMIFTCSLAMAQRKFSLSSRESREERFGCLQH